ncbi:MAG: hypothetical protein JW915_06410 [Chitinispirillaceae bacterium]|nr:hypothetical protein [Chitinispirillaceae bacterium]
MQLVLKKIMFLIIGSVVLSQIVYAQAPYRVHKNYEDTIRLAVIWNDAAGACDDSTMPVGQKTLDIVLKSLDTSKIRNIRTLRNRTADHTTWDDVVALWGEEKLPHCIVHVNAGWSVDWNERELDTVFSRAVARKIGIVSIGDDAASLASTTFGFDGVENVPAPLSDATTIDSLWIGLLRENDNKLKIYLVDSILQYPGLNGIISNSVDSILKRADMPFFPFGEGRCQADADKYNILYPQWITMLGYQQGYDDGETLNGPNELNVLVAIQDTINAKLIRRAVALSYQPQFLQDSIAAQQITYDAIMFASLTHMLSVASKITVHVDGDSVHAGEKINIRAELFDQYNLPITDKLDLVQWEIMDKLDVDSLSTEKGELTQFSSTRAWRTVTIKAVFHDPETNATVSTTAPIVIIPGPPHHVDAGKDASSALQRLNEDIPAISITFRKENKRDSVYAFVRDRFENYIRVLAETGTWISTDSSIATATRESAATNRGIITKENSGIARIIISEESLIPDTVEVNVDSPGTVKMSYTRDTDGNGFIDQIELHFDTLLTFADAESLKKQLSLKHENITFKISTISAGEKNTDSVLIIKIHEDSSKGLQTDWLVDVEGSIPVIINDQADQSKIYVKQTTTDGIGPVLEYALYAYTTRSGAPDTMLLVLSELVNNSVLRETRPSNAFTYYSYATGLKEIALLDRAQITTESQDAFIDTLKIIIDQSVAHTFVLTTSRDLMQYVHGAQDAAGNTPPSKTTSRKVPVEVIGRNRITISIYPNPIRFDNSGISQLPDHVRNHYNAIIGANSSGTLISIHSRKALKKMGNSYAKLQIYDAVGNLVIRQLEVMQAKSTQDYGCIWDGCNEQGRRVGGGTYLIVINGVDIDGMTFKEYRKIGVSNDR